MNTFDEYERYRDLRTVSEAALELGTNKNNIYSYLKSGLLKGIRYGDRGNWHIPMANIIEFKKQNVR